MWDFREAGVAALLDATRPRQATDPATEPATEPPKMGLLATEAVTAGLRGPVAGGDDKEDDDPCRARVSTPYGTCASEHTQTQHRRLSEPVTIAVRRSNAALKINRYQPERSVGQNPKKKKLKNP